MFTTIATASRLQTGGEETGVVQQVKANILSGKKSQLSAKLIN